MPDEPMATIKHLAKGTLALLLGALVFAVVMVKVLEPPIPSTLSQAKLEGRLWSESEIDLARSVTHKQLIALANALNESDRKGDMAVAIQAALETGPILRAWNDQADGVRQRGRDCVLAAVHVSHGADSVAMGQGWDRRQFDAAMSDCRP